MTSSEIIDIHGGWTSKDGKHKIQIVQTLDKFEGFVGSPEDVKISLGTISERTLNFKQTWHMGKNKGAVATVYGQLTSDSSTILLEFQGRQANGRGMKGKNAIFRENLIGSWTPYGRNGSGDVWSFNLENSQDITGYYKPNKAKEGVSLKGQRNHEDANFFTISLETSNKRENQATEEINGEFKCPRIILDLPTSLGKKSVLLIRKRQESLPKYEEYDPLPLVQEEEPEVFLNGKGKSFGPKLRPVRDDSAKMQKRASNRGEKSSQNPGEPEDMRSRFLTTVSHSSGRSHKKCCCTIM